MGKLTQDEKNAIRDAGVAKWWEDWFKEDYSWDGLAKKPWHGWLVVEDEDAYQDYIKKHELPEGSPNITSRVIPKDHVLFLPEGTPTRKATLQDYWRDQENAREGITGQEKTYTIAHLPVKYEDGTPSWKDKPDHPNWEKLSALVTARLVSAAQTKLEIVDTGHEHLLGLDRRAQLCGCVLPAIQPHSEKTNATITKNSAKTNKDEYIKSEDEALHLTLANAVITKRQNFDKAVFGSGANFNNVQFLSGNTSFKNAQFSGGDTNFYSVQFSGGKAHFNNAQFSGGSASFRNAQFSGGDVEFFSAQFSGGKAHFFNAQFSGGDAFFGSAQFSGGDAHFNSTQFSGGNAHFNNTHFSGGNAGFNKALFSGGDASFYNARFSGGVASFKTTRFTGGYAHFLIAQFSGGYASFNNAQFSGGHASFERTQFSGGQAFFDNAQFSGGYASFYKAQFSGGDASFETAQFTGGDASFEKAQFTGGKANFSAAQFKESCKFQTGLFERQVHFIDTVFPPAKGSESAFRGTQFLGPVDFSRPNIKNTKDENGKAVNPNQYLFPFNAFDNANIKDQLLLSGQGDKDAQIEFDLAMASVKAACRADDNAPKIVNKKAKREDRYVALERGCTTLKRAMENISDRNRAQRFFKFELLARQHRPSTSWGVRQMTNLYGLFADYGGSISRPLWGLLVSWIVFALIYGLNAYWIGLRLPENPSSLVWGPMDFSFTHIFRPFFVWSTSAPPSEASWLSCYKDALYPSGWLSIKVIATIQSFLSITLIFLFGLSTKRKFQIG